MDEGPRTGLTARDGGNAGNAGAIPSPPCSEQIGGCGFRLIHPTNPEQYEALIFINGTNHSMRSGFIPDAGSINNP